MKHVSLFLLLSFVTALVIYGISLTAPGLLVPIVYLAIAALIGIIVYLLKVYIVNR
ncbi:hypothetical protein [Exiguobacterium sp. BG5(2022)]|uniref:hypothetical protein n=1 Tax=Exiguobacterium sp. BG5(2022) TaxID=2962595 RepID=UPI002882369A|nr:hypothetical protein [Exiguobacterium sp. BG5(2022)]MDT0192381.1 hypothetical protein [Exiguobacterium sp. BG5(2022)]